MDNNDSISTRVLFVENENKCSELDKQDVQYVIIKNDGKIEEGLRATKDKVKFYLVIGLVISIAIVISYLVTYSRDELFNGGEAVFSFFYQLAIAYLMSCLFYYITCIVPQRVRRKKTRIMINDRLAQIVWEMSNVAREIKRVEDLEKKRINFAAKSTVIDCNSLNMAEYHYFSVADYVALTTKKIVENCKWILAIFYSDLPVETVVKISEVMNTYINMPDFSDTVKESGVIEVVGDDIVDEYESIIEEIKKCGIN